MALHELAHAAACVLLGVKVTKAKLWGLSGASITHQQATGWKNFIISTAPFFVNSLAALLSLYLGHIGLAKIAFLDWGRLVPVLLFYWLGVSFAYFAFPSETDLRSGWGELWRHYVTGIIFRRGVASAILCWLTLPLLPLAWLAVVMLRLSNQPRAGFAWAAVLFLVSALYVGI